MLKITSTITEKSACSINYTVIKTPVDPYAYKIQNLNRLKHYYQNGNNFHSYDS